MPSARACKSCASMTSPRPARRYPWRRRSKPAPELQADMALAAALDNHADAFHFGIDIELFDADAHARDAPVGEAKLCHPIGEGFDQIDMPARRDALDALDNGLVIEHGADFIAPRRFALHADLDADAQARRPGFLMRVDADARRQDEIADEDAIGRGTPRRGKRPRRSGEHGIVLHGAK